jgi:hypothetical protein
VFEDSTEAAYIFTYEGSHWLRYLIGCAASPLARPSLAHACEVPFPYRGPRTVPPPLLPCPPAPLPPSHFLLAVSTAQIRLASLKRRRRAHRFAIVMIFFGIVLFPVWPGAHQAARATSRSESYCLGFINPLTQYD